MRRVVSGRVIVVVLACVAAFLRTDATRLSAQGDTRERTLFVTAVDRMDNPVEGLDLSDITIREDGVRREVLRISRATEPIDVAILVDNASASGELIPRVREGMKGFVAALTPQHSLALIALADRPTILVDYTTNAAALLAGSQRLFALSRSGATLLDGIVETAAGLRQREAVRAAIVPIVTDGIEYSNRRHQDVANAVKDSGAGFYPISVGRFEIANPGDAAHERAIVLGDVPGASGGRRLNLLSSNAIEATMVRVARYLTSQYKVVYSRPETLIPPEHIEVSTTRVSLTIHGTPARAGGNTK